MNGMDDADCTVVVVAVNFGLWDGPENDARWVTGFDGGSDDRCKGLGGG